MADRRLQVFYTVAKQLSFTKAAEILFMTQPAVTFQVKQLEEHFNTRLFERSHGKISLTPVGDLVLGYAERILALTGEMEARVGEMTGQVTGPLMIGASTTIAEYQLPRILEMGLREGAAEDVAGFSGSSDVLEFLVLTGVPLRTIPPHLGSRKDILRRYGCLEQPP